MAKYYAVRKGYHPGIYKGWENCENEVFGFSKAEFKSFRTEAEAKKYLKDDLKLEQPKENVGIDDFDGCQVIAYVDGSYDNDTKRASFGVVIREKTAVTTKSGLVARVDWLPMRNIAGEITAAIEALNACVELGYTSVKLVYDYEGIGKWGYGEWQAKKPIAKEYLQTIEGMKLVMFLTFQHVKGHSGNKFNELADRLAKSELGL